MRHVPMTPYREIVQFVQSGQPFALGLVLSAEGSTPREAGTRALLEADGRIRGTLGGGAVEAEAQRQAVEACRTGRARAFEFELAGETASGCEPICGGRGCILVDPTAGEDETAYEEAAKALERRGKGALLTVIHGDGDVTTSSHWRAEDGQTTPPLPHSSPDSDTLRGCLEAGKVALFRETDRASGVVTAILVEPVVPAPLLIIVGGGHVGQALAAQAALIGFDITVLDDRPAFTDAALFPEGAMTQCGDIARTLGEQAIGADTYIVIVTRGHQHDAEALRACIREPAAYSRAPAAYSREPAAYSREPAAYIGMIGSRRKVALLRQESVASGWATDEEWGRVFAPIGVDIGAETVPEIATSIAAQLVAVRRRGREKALARGAMPR